MNCRMKSGNYELGTLLPTRGILVIARSDSDKVIQCGASELDCFDLKLMGGRRRRRQRPLAWLRLGPPDWPVPRQRLDESARCVEFWTLGLIFISRGRTLLVYANFIPLATRGFSSLVRLRAEWCARLVSLAARLGQQERCRARHGGGQDRTPSGLARSCDGLMKVARLATFAKTWRTLISPSNLGGDKCR